MADKIDLSIGNPSFLNDYWKGQDLPEESSIYYPSPYMEGVIKPELERAIRHVHRTIGNIKNVDDYHIVIGNGASQLISVAMHCMRNWMAYSAPKPHYHKFPILAEISGTGWSFGSTDSKIQTIPNNPTGTIDLLFKDKNTIVDACYNWPQYCKPVELDNEIIIYSLSKATGHSGTRLGWALIKDKDLAQEIIKNIENQTMGVSDLAQEVGRFVLLREASRFAKISDNVFSWGKAELDKRWSRIWHAYYDEAGGSKLGFKILNNRGMFLWCEGEIPEHVKGYPGTMFGDDSENKFRLNIGCSIYDFNRFLGEYEDDIQDGSESEEMQDLSDSEETGF